MKLSKLFKAALAGLLTLLILLLSAALLIANFYEDEVKQVLVGQLNKRLATPVSVKNIELSLIKKFPNASLVFTDVVVESVNKADSSGAEKLFKEPLFKAHSIFLQFNVFDIFHHNYTLKTLEIEDAKLNVLIAQNGEDNFHFWKKSSDTTNSNFSLSLDKIKVNSLDVVYNNAQTNQLYSLVVKQSELSGNFSSQKYNLITNGNYYVDEIKINNTVYVKRKSVELEGELFVENNERFSFNNLSLLVNELTFDVKGNINFPEKENTTIDLDIKGKNLDIKTFLSLLPEQQRKSLKTYSSSGLFYFDAKIKGAFGNEINPGLSAKFGIQNGIIKESESGLSLKNLALTGVFSNGKGANSESSSISISSFNAQLGTGKLVGNGSLHNFTYPMVKFMAEAHLNLEEVKRFLKLDTLELCSGNLVLDLDFEGSSSALKNLSSTNLSQVKAGGNLTIEQGSLKLKGNKQTIQNINTSLMFNNNDVVINECNFAVQNSDIAIKGFFRNALTALFNPDQKLFIEATLESRFINLDEILADDETQSKSTNSFELRFSNRINFNFNASIQRLVFKHFEAKKISGTIQLQNKKLALSPISFLTMDGNVLARGIIDGTDSTRFSTLWDADLHSIDISKLFYSFQNFGGSTLTEKNLRGQANSSIQFSGNFTPQLNAISESFVAQFNLEILNGSLINFEPMKKLSRFISLSELSDIRFATLKNTIEIKKRNILIPKMEINSSALNLTVSGTHSFDNVVNYHFKLLLNELLTKKAKKAKPENETFGILEDDGLGGIRKTAIYISMLGPLENPKISYDKSGLKTQMKEHVASEKQSLKSILKSEFGWFKNDTTLKNAQPKKQVAKFETEWEESDKSQVKKQNSEKTLPKVVKESDNASDGKKIKLFDNLLKKADSEPKKPTKKPEKEENSDDYD